jgi:hypothetical protein
LSGDPRDKAGIRRIEEEEELPPDDYLNDERLPKSSRRISQRLSLQSGTKRRCFQQYLLISPQSKRKDAIYPQSVKRCRKFRRSAERQSGLKGKRQVA